MVKSHCRFVLPVLLACALAGCYSIQAMKRLDVDYFYILDEAKKCAENPYNGKSKELPKELQSLNYDGYRKLRFIEDQTLWRKEGLAFQTQFFHLGYIFKEPVELHEFTATHMQRIPYVSDFFDFKDFPAMKEKLGSELDYAGFRVLYRLNPGNKRYDELISFLGASYFRALGADMHYGLSARGLAIDCASNKAEEFPRFTRFWLKKPLGDSSSMVFYALLDSPSVSGAYEFVLTPGKTTRVDVKATLFMRENVQSFGVAPLTSMFWFGENSRQKPSDARPEVHDSDGLMLKTSVGDVIWRPLDTGNVPRHTYIKLDSPAGFGLMQRDRAFSSYEDLEAEYHRRPSLWVQPRGDWGKGRVRLMELSTRGETEDNMVAFWEPEVLPTKGSQCMFEYSLFWTNDSMVGENSRPFVSSTRSGYEQQNTNELVYILDFAPGVTSKFSPDQVPKVDAKVEGNASLSFSQALWNPQSSRWRVTLKVKCIDETKQPFDLSCRLQFDDGNSSELWTYKCSP